MPVVSPFGELALGDTVSLDKWLAAHAQRHQVIVRLLGLRQNYATGSLIVPVIQLQTGPVGGNLDGPVDGDWMHRHTARHFTLSQITAAQHYVMQRKTATFNASVMTSSDTNALDLPGMWTSEQQLADWNDLHNRLHQLIDKLLQVYQLAPQAPAPTPPGQPPAPPVPPKPQPPPQTHWPPQQTQIP
jgi:hypothetical protein